MTRRHQSNFLLAALAAGFTALAWPGGAVGEPSAVCVRCTGPAQSYLCEVSGANVGSGSRTAGFYCAARLAQEHGHRTCAVARNDVQCEGEYRHYVHEPGAAEVPTIGVAIKDAPEAQSAEPSEQGAAKRKEGPPETVVELTRETARKTEESLKQAADDTAEATRGVGQRMRDAAAGAAETVGRATRNTIKCIGSLFDDC